MAAGLARASSQENVSTSLSSGITDVASSMDVADASKIQSPGYLVIDRVDSSGTLKSTSLWEFVKVTNIVSNTLTITRGQGGSTQQAHSSGAVVESVMTATLMEEYYAALNPEHTATGGHVISTATVTTLNVSGSIVGLKGQFVWSSPGALVTSLATAPGDPHLPFLRANKNLTINNCWVGLNSAPSLAVLTINIDYRATPTTPLATIFTTKPTIDIGEYTTDTAATAAVLALTSLASGSLLFPSIAGHGEAGDLTLALNCTER